MSLMARYRKPKRIASAPTTNNGAGALLLTTKETAEYLGYPLNRVRTLIKQEKLKLAQATHPFYITRAECDRYLAQVDKNAETYTGPKPQNVRKPPHRNLRNLTDKQLQEHFQGIRKDIKGVRPTYYGSIRNKQVVLEGAQFEDGTDIQFKD
jgi:hypothetical protein